MTPQRSAHAQQLRPGTRLGSRRPLAPIYAGEGGLVVFLNGRKQGLTWPGRPRLAELGHHRPRAIRPAGRPLCSLTPARSGTYVFTAGQLPARDGEHDRGRKVGGEVTEVQQRTSAPRSTRPQRPRRGEGRDLARRAARGQGRCSTPRPPDFTGQPKVANGASDPAEGFRRRRQACRSAVGVAVLPLYVPVEVEITRRGLRLGTLLFPRRSSPRPGRTPRAGRTEPRDRWHLFCPRDWSRGCRRRQTSMAFAAGMCVFRRGRPARLLRRPGSSAVSGQAGGADAAGRRRAQGASARCAPRSARRSRSRARGRCRRRSSPTPPVPTGADRVALESRELSMMKFSSRSARWCCALTSSAAVRPGWFEPRRYRTSWLLVARLPEGQVTRDVSSESWPCSGPPRAGRG